MIIDASVGVKWVVTEDDTELALRLLDLELMVPALFHAEVANALWKKSMLQQIAISEVLPQLPKLRLIASEIDDGEYIASALEIATELRHPVYDCLYLAAAMALDEIVVTADARFLRKVAKTRYEKHVRSLDTWRP
ncbi:MAG: type II toxin-antitoxin system VapC family toxin [Novosphingobium sp.]